MSSWTDALVWEPVRVLWLATPVIVAGLIHTSVIRLRLLERLKVPLDGGRTYRGRRLFGDNKTWRGVVVMIAATSLVALLQSVARAPGLEYAGLDYSPGGLALTGALLGLGFVLGELPNSFLKRQRNVAPGARGSPLFVVLDQVDSLVGCLACLCVVWVPPWTVWAWVLVLGAGAHMFVNWVMVRAGVKERVF